MSNKNSDQMSSTFALEPVEDETKYQAQLTVAQYATDPEDLRLILQALGICERYKAAAA